MSLTDLKKQISAYMPYDDFMKIQVRLAQLRKEEEDKLKALADLQQAFVSAKTESEIEVVRKTVGEIREISRAAKQEIRQLIRELQKHMSIDLARDFYAQVLKAGDGMNQSPK